VGHRLGRDPEWFRFKRRVAVLVYALAQVCPKDHVCRTFIRKFSLLLAREGKFDRLPKVLNRYGPDPPELGDALDELEAEGILKTSIVEAPTRESEHHRWYRGLTDASAPTKHLHKIEVAAGHVQDVVEWARSEGIKLDHLIQDCRDIKEKYGLSLKSVSKVGELWRKILIDCVSASENYLYWSLRWVPDADTRREYVFGGLDTAGPEVFRIPVLKFEVRDKPPLAILKELAKSQINAKQTAPEQCYRIRSINQRPIYNAPVILFGRLKGRPSLVRDAGAISLTLDQCENEESALDRIEVWLDQHGTLDDTIASMKSFEVAVLGHISASADKRPIIKAYAIIRAGDPYPGSTVLTLDDFLPGEVCSS
jgi:hypothetical protein